MYLTSISRSQKLKHFNNAISTLRKLKEAQSPQLDKQTDKIVSFNNLIVSLKDLREKVLRTRRKEMQKLVENSQDKFRISTFSLMEYDFDENTHSNVLQYIFDYNLIGQDGAEILSSFVKKTSQEFEAISKLIKTKKYTVEREYSVDNGRIDLFIKDEPNKFVVVIENKILSPISIKESDENDDSTISKTQLTNYYKAINHRFPSKTYKQAFILLSYSEIEKPEKYLPFIFTNYSILSDVLKSIKTNDNIMNEYHSLLDSLGKFSPEELLNLKRDFLFYSQRKSTSNQSLNSIEKLRMVIYGNN